VAELPYWMEGKCGDKRTKIWVKTPIDRKGRAIVVAHTGQPHAESSSDMRAAFDRILDSVAVAWDFEETDGQLTQDTSGNNYKGHGVSTAVRDDGMFGRARYLSGNGAYVYAPAGSNPKWHGHFTAALWIKTKETKGYWISESNPGSSGCWRFFGKFTSSGAPELHFWDNSHSSQRYRKAIAKTSVTDGKWHHIVISLSKTDKSLRVYVDGLQEADTITTANEGTYSQLWVGGVWGGCLGNHATVSTIDSFRQYGRSLTRHEIYALAHGVSFVSEHAGNEELVLAVDPSKVSWRGVSEELELLGVSQPDPMATTTDDDTADVAAPGAQSEDGSNTETTEDMADDVSDDVPMGAGSEVDEDDAVSHVDSHVDFNTASDISDNVALSALDEDLSLVSTQGESVPDGAPWQSDTADIEVEDNHNDIEQDGI